ncbi:MAG: cysteine hydrolase [Bacteroidetes bacterium]|nr:cysteine hydrolase [Bacteroidota bacterium]
MKIHLIFSLLLLTSLSPSLISQEQKDKTALIIIDIQEFYYPGGSSELFEPEAAGKKARQVLERFRENGDLVIHVRHNAAKGGDIHKDVAPIEGEKVISKDQVNSFRDTDLLAYLKENNITDLVLVGMQTNMCLEAATRAGADYGFKCTVIEDACATKDQKFGDHLVKAKDVHYVALATLRAYAKITNTETYLGK